MHQVTSQAHMQQQGVRLRNQAACPNSSRRLVRLRNQLQDLQDPLGERREAECAVGCEALRCPLYLCCLAAEDRWQLSSSTVKRKRIAPQPTPHLMYPDIAAAWADSSGAFISTTPFFIFFLLLLTFRPFFYPRDKKTTTWVTN